MPQQQKGSLLQSCLMLTQAVKSAHSQLMRSQNAMHCTAVLLAVAHQIQSPNMYKRLQSLLARRYIQSVMSREQA